MILQEFRPDFQQLHRDCNPPSDCKHPSIELRNKPDKNNNPRFHNQCQICGSAAGKRVPQAEVQDPELVALFDVEFEQRAWTEFRERYEHQKDLLRKECRRKWERSYKEYLSSNEWKAKRKLVMLRAQGICEGCRIKPATEIHHNTYENVGEEFLFQLLALCSDCHRRYHDSTLPAFLERLFNG